MTFINHREHQWHQYAIRNNIHSYITTVLTALERSALKNNRYSCTFYTLNSIQKVRFGERSDGACWTFKVYGHKGEPEFDKACSFEARQLRYIMQHFYLKMHDYTLVQTEARCSCGGSRIDTGICLPEVLEKQCKKIINTESRFKRAALMDTFSQELLVHLTAKSGDIAGSSAGLAYAA